MLRGANENCGSSSVGRATAFQAVGRGFEPRLPLEKFGKILDSLLVRLHNCRGRLPHSGEIDFDC